MPRGYDMNKSIIEGCSKEVNPDLENTYILPGMLPGKPEKAGSWPIVTDDKTDKKFCKKCGKECCKEQANE